MGWESIRVCPRCVQGPVCVVYEAVNNDLVAQDVSQPFVVFDNGTKVGVEHVVKKGISGHLQDSQILVSAVLLTETQNICVVPPTQPRRQMRGQLFRN